MVDSSKKVPDLNCEVQDLLLEVVDLKQEVPDLRSGGIPLHLTPGYFVGDSLRQPTAGNYFVPPVYNVKVECVEGAQLLRPPTCCSVSIYITWMS